jgi:hypothetical protein
MKNIAPDVELGKNVQLNEFINLYGCKIGDQRCRAKHNSRRKPGARFEKTRLMSLLRS